MRALSPVSGRTGLSLLLLIAGVGCSTTPPPVTFRTFERAQKMDVVCLAVRDAETGLAKSPSPLPVESCNPTGASVDGTYLPNHLFAVVTQTARGEVAVVDLTAQSVLDTDKSTPGINFLPVGIMPTDIVSSPTSEMVFVSTGEPNKYALYGIPHTRLLGDAQGLAPDAGAVAPQLTAWPTCSLPQAPIALSTIPTKTGGYVVAVALQSTSSQSAKVVLVDPLPLLRGAGLRADAGPTIAPGSLSDCPIVSALALSPTVPTAVPRSDAWQDGVPYVAGGVDISGDLPSLAGSCPNTTTTSATMPVPPGPYLGPSVAALARDGNLLYVADAELPLIHVIDLSDPSSPKELPPLVATSAQDPSRRVSVSAIAVSPTTRDYRRFLYAIDRAEGSIMVFDITTQPSAPRPPLLRPHAELSPLSPRDRIIFSSPAAQVAFVQNDWPLTNLGDKALSAAKTGIACNPNPNAGSTSATFGTSDEALGAYYRANAPDFGAALGPYRLRGVFGIVALANGLSVVIDVDDWDAPCRRPDGMDTSSRYSTLMVPQPTPTSTQDLNPYHTPLAYQTATAGTSAVTVEAFYPAVAPHRARSANYLRNDNVYGVHAPSLYGPPQLTVDGALRATNGAEGAANPIMLPTYAAYIDPGFLENPAEPDPAARIVSTQAGSPAPNTPAFALPGQNQWPSVRMSWEDPTAHWDQNWTVTYEGSIPGFEGISTQLATTDGYRTLTASNPSGLFCQRGVEDADMGKQRVVAEAAEADRLGIPRFDNAALWTSDYIQVADEILDRNHPYWEEQGQDCWDPSLSTGRARHDACVQTYGKADDLDTNLQRDFPILEAADGTLRLGRFGYQDPAVQTVASRQIVSADDSNVAALKLLRCCFHSQVKFRVRTGGRWLAVGSVSGYSHHVTVGSGGRCEQSCESSSRLLNARAPELLRPEATSSSSPPDRNSVLSLRNPSFSLAMWAGAGVTRSSREHTTTPRNAVFSFATRGQFVPLSVSLGGSSSAVSTQSMRFLPTLGQLAVVDGAAQGLVLVDLARVALARAPYY